MIRAAERGVGRLEPGVLNSKAAHDRDGFND